MTEPIDQKDQQLREMLRAALDAEAATMSPDAGLAQLHRRLRRPAWWRRIRWPSLPSLAPLTITALASLCLVQGWLLWQPRDPADQLQCGPSCSCSQRIAIRFNLFAMTVRQPLRPRLCWLPSYQYCTISPML